MKKPFSTLVIAAISFAVLTGCQSAADPKVEKTTATPAAATPKTADPADSAPRITLADAKKEFDGGTAVFVDTRAEAQFKMERVKGAINVPADAIETRYKSIPAGKKIIAYCS